MNYAAPLTQSLSLVSLFSGIGGFELGMEAAGHRTVLMCESDPAARAVLRHRFPDTEIADDVTTLSTLPNCDLVTAGWPCQDISLAGGTQGLKGARSGLIEEVFRLVRSMPRRPRYILLENVAFALDLRRGEAVRYVTDQLGALGYRWAYRILDTRLFGLPQRRRRVFILAALVDDPASILLDGIDLSPVPESQAPTKVGFYWTEGTRGLGWSPDVIPPLKGGSGLGIPSPPAIWDVSSASFVAPGIEDAERLQGFPAGWTEAAENLARGKGRRWVLTGNAVSVPVAEWLGQQLAAVPFLPRNYTWAALPVDDRLAKASSGGPNIETVGYMVSREGPTSAHTRTLDDFEVRTPKLLSTRAIGGFTRRFEAAPLKKNPEFLRDLKAWLTPTTP